MQQSPIQHILRTFWLDRMFSTPLNAHREGHYNRETSRLEFQATSGTFVQRASDVDHRKRLTGLRLTL